MRVARRASRPRGISFFDKICRYAAIARHRHSFLLLIGGILLVMQAARRPRASRLSGVLDKICRFAKLKQARVFSARAPQPICPAKVAAVRR